MRTKIKVLFSLIFIVGLISTSCVKDKFDEPEVKDPSEITSGLTPNITIQEIKDMYDSLTVVDGNVKTFTTDLILEAKVISTDKYGNFYKEMYVEDATGGLVLSIDGSNLFNDFNLGQTVHIKLKGLNINYDLSFKAIVEIGFGLFDNNGEKKLGRIPVSILKDYVFKNGAPSTPTTTTITLDNTSLTDANVGKFVKIENAQFIDSDTNATYADAAGQQSQSLNLESCSGTTQLVLRSSGYALFAGTSVPTGNGDIMGVLTKYGTQGYQLIINTDNDVEFTSTRCGGGSGSGTGTGSGTFDDPYDVEAGISNQSSTGVWVTGYLVGVYNTDGTDNISELNSPFTIAYNVFLAPTANETDTSKMILVQLPSGDIRNATNLSDNGSLYQQEVKYHGNLATYNTLPGLKSTDGYWIISTNTGIDPDYVIPGTIWSEDFSSIANPYDPITSMTVVMEAGTKDWHGDGYNGQSAEMSAYQSTEASNIGWLITPAIDLTTATAPKLTFKSSLKYFAGDLLTVWVSTDYDGGTSPQTATWTELTTANIVDSNDPVDGASGMNFTTSGDVDLSAYLSSSTVYIAWKYVGGDTPGQTTKYRVDDIRIGE